MQLTGAGSLVRSWVLVQIKDTFQRAMGIPIGIVLYTINPNN